MANLSQLAMLESLDGVLLVDKPSGIAFTTVVKAVKRRFGLVKVGHGGSLDAAASGLLVLLIGEANKLAGDMMGADRVWSGSMRLGLTTNTGDAQGTVLSEKTVAFDEISPDRLAKAITEFRGDIFQVEPRFCSVRREGSAAYEVADTGEHTQYMAHVYRFTPRASSDPAVVDFDLRASKGVLVRALVGDFGSFLGCGATLCACRRLKVGGFDVADAVPFNRLLEVEAAEFASLVQPAAKAMGW